MKGFICMMMVLFFILLLVPDAMPARSIALSHQSDQVAYAGFSGDALTPVGSDTNNVVKRQLHAKRKPIFRKKRGRDTVQIAGSRLPDCAHACGSCSPCRLVMVSFKCSLLAEAETCPMAYKCICNTKSFPVP